MRQDRWRRSWGKLYYFIKYIKDQTLEQGVKTKKPEQLATSSHLLLDVKLQE
jgi:hypothetical protein